MWVGGWVSVRERERERESVCVCVCGTTTFLPSLTLTLIQFFFTHRIYAKQIHQRPHQAVKREDFEARKAAAEALRNAKTSTDPKFV